MNLFYFVTTNNGKYREAKEILKQFGITLMKINDEKPELQDLDMKRIVVHSAMVLSKKHRKSVIVEDSGLYLEAYRMFPGTLTRLVHHCIGFDGLFKLLEGKSRKAYFRSVVGYCEPGKNPIVFEGILRGSIADKPYKGAHPRLVHDEIFIPDGYERTLSLMLEEKQKISHRRQAFEKLGEYLK
ncbi:MAG: non-canonical purine NTP pyrophosphatase [Candidatus Woesearchaeota archaeon]